jgi:mannose-1-phosphate guanylyltransferase
MKSISAFCAFWKLTERKDFIMTSAKCQQPRCGIIMAGGEGKRLRPFVRRMIGYELPKQYVRFTGNRSLLQEAFDRAERLIPPEQVFTVISRDHLSYAEVQIQIEQRTPKTLIVQPMNRETGPGLLLPLMHLYKQYGNATVAVFPSDHFIFRDDLFNLYLRQAFEAVEKCADKIVLLGVEPTEPESQYGYIVPESCTPGQGPRSVNAIKAFIEKPEPAIAAQIISSGALWNTMVMVFRADTLMHLVKVSAPRLHRLFQTIFHAIGTPAEGPTIEGIYKQMEPVNFSKDLIENFTVCSSQLAVISMKGVLWSDWGSEHRIISALQGFNVRGRTADRTVGSMDAPLPLEASL